MHLLVALAAAAIAAARTWLLLRARRARTWRWWLGWCVPISAIALACVELGLLPSLLVCEKVVASLCEPLGLAWLALWSLTASACWQRRWRWAAATGACALLISVLGNAWVADALMASLEAQVPPWRPPAQPYDAVLVLGGGTERGPDGRAELRQGGDRLLRAVELYTRGEARLLVASGSSVPGMERDHSNAVETAEIWRALGVPEGAIVLNEGPETTSAEVARFAAQAQERAWRHVAVLSSAWHLPRVLRLCRRQGLAADAVPCDWCGMMDPWSLVWVVPHGVYAERLSLAVWEYLARVAGR